MGGMAPQLVRTLPRETGMALRLKNATECATELARRANARRWHLSWVGPLSIHPDEPIAFLVTEVCQLLLKRIESSPSRCRGLTGGPILWPADVRGRRVISLTCIYPHFTTSDLRAYEVRQPRVECKRGFADGCDERLNLSFTRGVVRTR